MSEVKVNKISPRTNCGTVTLGDSGDSFVIPAGATITNNGTQTGFGRTGTVDWDTTAKTASFTAVSGTGYFVNTTSGAVTVTLPATPSSGNIVSVSDYNGTAVTNNITIARNGSNINGDASDYTISKADSAITFIYVDGTVGWTSVQTSNTLDTTNPFIVATGGTITECGDYKIHTFTGPGTFTVTNAGAPAGSNAVDYLVVAGGGGGGGFQGGGGGGAGGYRESSGVASGSYTASPLGACVSALPVTVTGYPITVGSGGAAGPGCNPGIAPPGGNPSIFSSITSSGGGGGGGGGGPCASTPGRNGGSAGGGGGRGGNAGGTGNIPPVSPPQGNPGGTSKPEAAPSSDSGGGGGGATAAGANGQNDCSPAGNGGAGATSSINGTPTTRAGGGGGAREIYTDGTGGSGGGGNGGETGTAGTINTGSGGGGGNGAGGAGGSGIVIIRYKFQ